jgi:hypothetical protein
VRVCACVLRCFVIYAQQEQLHDLGWPEPCGVEP